MSDAYQCDHCGDYYDGAPDARLFPNGGEDVTHADPPVEEENADLCGACWRQVASELGFTVLRGYEDGGSDE